MKVDEKLIKQCKKKNKGAQKKLFEILYSPIFKTCMVYSSCEDQAKDYLQLSFIRIFENIQNFKGKGSFEGWANRIARNIIIDDLRKTKKLICVDVSECEFIEEKEDGGVEFRELSPAQLIGKIQELPPAYRTVFSMRVLEEMTHKEISEELGIAEGTSKSNYHKAKKKLKELICEI